MGLRTVVIMVCVLGLSLLTGSVLAGNPLSKDEGFLFSDPDGDDIITWQEFILGTDPYNPDSDNDGLPDFWEHYIADMNPADCSDAHLDFDYYPSREGEVGENDAAFSEIRKDIDVWPSNSEITFVKVMYDEDGIHYDNYEEYYRSYRDPDDGYKVKRMSTLPFKPDTDGDGLLDPDDPWPVRYLNGGAPAEPPVEDFNYEAGDAEEDYGDTVPEDIISDATKVNVDLGFDLVGMDIKPKQQFGEGEQKLVDVDNDGI
jgi:hypothetical protein